MITILSGLELEVEISAFGLRGEERGVLLSGNVEVLIDLSTLFKLQFQHLLLRGIADAGNTPGVYRNSLHTFLDADEPTKYQMRSLCFKFPKTSVRRNRCGERAAVSFMPGGGLRLIRIDGSADLERKTEMVSGIGS
jgi:hypothetical protein